MIEMDLNFVQDVLEPNLSVDGVKSVDFRRFLVRKNSKIQFCLCENVAKCHIEPRNI